MYRYLPITNLHLCMTYESCTSKTTQIIVLKPKFWRSSVVTLTFDLLTPKCIGIFVAPACIDVWNMKYVRWKLVKSEPKCWQCPFVTLTFDLMTLKWIGIFLLSSCIYVWHMKAVRWTLLTLSCQKCWGADRRADRRTHRQRDRQTDKPYS